MCGGVGKRDKEKEKVGVRNGGRREEKEGGKRGGKKRGNSFHKA